MDLSHERLDLRVAREFSLSRRRAREVVECGQIDVAGKKATDPATPVSSRERVLFDPNRKKTRAVRFRIAAAYADDHIVVLNKPAGLLTVPTDGNAGEDCALNRLREDVESVRGRGAYVGALHRLDRGTSGLVAFALSRDVHARGRALFRRHAIERRYLALVKGVPRPASGVVDAPVADEYRGGRRHLARDEEEESKDAITHYRVVEALGSLSLVELKLETGRQHQIRLHMRHVGHPLVGDKVYADRPHGRAREGDKVTSRASLRPLLHAASLAFDHPISGRRVSVEAPLPADFSRALDRARAGRSR